LKLGKNNIKFKLSLPNFPKSAIIDIEIQEETLVEVYSAGNTDVIFTQAPLHYEILISNKHRAIREKEMEIIKEFFLSRKINQQAIDKANIKTLYSDKLIEISIPTK